MNADVIANSRRALEDVGVFLQSSPTGDYDGLSNVADTGEDKAFEFFTKRILHKDYDLTIFDVGSAVGEWTRIANRCTTYSNIYCFEPGHHYYEVAKKRCVEIGNNRIVLINKAVSNKSGPITFYIPQDGRFSHSSLIKENVSELRGNKVEEVIVEATTIKETAAQYNISNIDFLKIDVEGFEYKIIKSVFDAGIHENINALQFEYNDTYLTQRIFLLDFFELTKDTFVFTRICRDGLIIFPRYDPNYMELLGMQNILLINKKIISKMNNYSEWLATSRISFTPFNSQP